MSDTATVGRPSDYGPEIAAEICRRVADGQGMREISRDAAMPAMGTVFRWLAEHTDFQERYAKAKLAMAEHMAEDILDIADDGTNDWIERLGDDGQPLGWRENGEALGRSRLRVDARKWLLSKLMPKKYGERVQHANDPDDPITAPVDPRELTKSILAVLQAAVKPDPTE